MGESVQSAKVIRFGVFEADLRTAELRKQGLRIRLSGQSFQVLEAMLLRPGELVTREDLKQKLWPSDSFGDFEHGLNAAVNRLREALGDSSDNPRFIETLPRRGYRFIAPIQQTPVEQTETETPAETPPSQNQQAPSTPGLRHHMLGLAGAVISVLSLALLITWWSIPTAVPVVESIRQLTDDRAPKAHAMVSDGSRIYFNEGTPQHFSLAQVSVAGGLTAPVETRLANAYVLGIANDGSALIVLVPSGPEVYPGDSLWSVPLPAGEPRRLISGEVFNATNLPDGRIVFATTVFGKDPKGTDSRTDWFLAGNDGSNPRKLVSLPGLVGEVNASPDGRRILISQVISGQSQRLFEISADGTGLREIRKLNEDECCFAWSPDEKYLIYQSGHAPQSDIWALPVKAGLLRHPGVPIRLTNGPLPYSAAHPSRDGKQIFVIGTKQRGELVRYDMESHGFVPFLSGISATDPTFSQDGKWVAYVSYPDGSVWRSRSDGSERVQLTYPPITAFYPAISPDGAKVSYHTDKDELFVVSMEGGLPKKIDDNANYANWSPDGNYLLYQNAPGPLQIIDVRTGKKSAVPSSEHKDSGFWLTQDILVVRNQEHTNFMTFNFKNQKWTELTPGGLGDIQDWMMSPDHKYLYFITGGAEPKTMRLRVADNQLETITSLKDLHRAVMYVGSYGLTQINVAPDGSPVFTRDIGYDELYALNVRWP